MEFETKINGGKLFLDGKEIQLKNDGGGILTGKIFVVEEKQLLISAGDLRIDGDHVLNLSQDEWEELKGGAE